MRFNCLLKIYRFCGVKNGVAKLRKKFTTKGRTSLVFISDDTVSMSGFVIDVKSLFII